VFTELPLRRVNRIDKCRSPRPFNIESLENRLLLRAPPNITGVIADNRGDVVISISRGLGASTVNRQSVQVYTAGSADMLGTSDDVNVDTRVTYDTPGQRILIKSRGLVANTAYRVRLLASKIMSPDGKRLDGEFSGTFPTGNGQQGGNFDFQARNDKGQTPAARVTTSDGTMKLTLRKDVAPNTVGNFLNYANTGRYDNVFWTRSDVTQNGETFVIQGGSLQIIGK